MHSRNVADCNNQDQGDPVSDREERVGGESIVAEGIDERRSIAGE